MLAMELWVGLEIYIIGDWFDILSLFSKYTSVKEQQQKLFIWPDTLHLLCQ